MTSETADCAPQVRPEILDRSGQVDSPKTDCDQIEDIEGLCDQIDRFHGFAHKKLPSLIPA